MASLIPAGEGAFSPAIGKPEKMNANRKGASVRHAPKADTGHVHVMLKRLQSPALVADVEAWAHTSLVQTLTMSLPYAGR